MHLFYYLSFLTLAEIYCEALPRMHQIYFNSDVINELLYLEAPYEVELPSGFMRLTFEKAVVDSVYKHFRVVHEGKLCILFTQLKVNQFLVILLIASSLH